MKTFSSITAMGVILALAVSTPLTGAAQAHGYLMDTFPPRHETVDLPVALVKLHFSVKADPNYSKVSIESRRWDDRRLGNSAGGIPCVRDAPTAAQPRQI